MGLVRGEKRKSVLGRDIVWNCKWFSKIGVRILKKKLERYEVVGKKLVCDKIYKLC